MIRSYSIRLRPTKRQVAELEHVLAVSCELYNAALGERRSAWQTCQKSINYYDQQAELTELRKVDPETASLIVDIAREPLRRVDRAFKAFFRRVRAGHKSGYPRWRSIARYNSFSTSVFSIHEDVVHVAKINLRFKTHRELRGQMRQCTVIRRDHKWTARIVCDIGPAPEKVAVSNAVGIDLGLENFIYCSDGSRVDNPRWTTQHAERIARKQRQLASKKRGSRNREKAKIALGRAYAKVRSCRSNFAHHVSKALVSQYDLIAYEKLNVAGMVRSTFAKSILDAAWTQLIRQIIYKAENAGKWAVAVNPRGTSQRCSGCGAIKTKDISERQHTCPCGADLHRDHNAALNVLALGQRVVGTSAGVQYA